MERQRRGSFAFFDEEIISESRTVAITGDDISNVRERITAYGGFAAVAGITGESE